MSDALRELYQEVIIDHSKRPRNFTELPFANYHAEGFNPLCGDQINLYLEVESDVIKNVTFTGKGCAISTASASLMTETLKNKTLAQAEEIFGRFHSLLTEEGCQENGLGKLQVLAGVKEYPVRVKCATLAWHTLQAALQNKTQPVSTE